MKDLLRKSRLRRSVLICIKFRLIHLNSNIDVHKILNSDKYNCITFITIRYAGQLSMVTPTKVANNCSQFTKPPFPHPKWRLCTTVHNFKTSTKLQGLRELSVKQQSTSTRTAYCALCLSARVGRYIYTSPMVLRTVFGSWPLNFFYSKSIWYHRLPISYMEQGDCILRYFILPPTTRSSYWPLSSETSS